MIRSKARLLLAAAIASACGLLCAEDEAGKILRPADNSSHTSDQLDIVATAPSGRLAVGWRADQERRAVPERPARHPEGGARIALTRAGLGGRQEGSAVLCRPQSSRGFSTLSPASADSRRAMHSMPQLKPERPFHFQRRLFRLPSTKRFCRNPHSRSRGTRAMRHVSQRSWLRRKGRPSLLKGRGLQTLSQSVTQKTDSLPDNWLFHLPGDLISGGKPQAPPNTTVPAWPMLSCWRWSASTRAAPKPPD